MTRTTATYVYRLPLPPRGSGSNARLHWAQRARVTRAYRETCAAAYRAQGVPPAPLEYAHVEIEMRVCRKRVPETLAPAATADVYQAWATARNAYRPTDRANVHDACKAAIDALQSDRSDPLIGAGVVVSDRGTRLSVGAPELVTVRSFGEEGVWLTVSEGMR